MKRLLSLALLTSVSGLAHAACFDTTLKATRTAEELVADGPTVVDLVSGLEWQRCALGATFDPLAERCTGTPTKLVWDVALRQAKAFSDASGTPAQQSWRLPNVKELQSVIDAACYRPVVRPAYYPDTPSDAFWTSTPDHLAPGDRAAPLLYINFEDGLTYTPTFAGAAYSRLVRNLRP